MAGSGDGHLSSSSGGSAGGEAETRDSKVVVVTDPAAHHGEVDAKPKTDEEVDFIKLFSSADNMDYVLMAVGTFGACVHGCAFPMFAIVFGEFADAFGNADSPDFMDQVIKIALYFVYIAIAAMVAAYLQTAFWTWTGNRQTVRLRTQYLNAVLRQDVSYFDTQTSTGVLLQTLTDDSSAVQAAIGDKLGHFIQHCTCFLVGYIIALWRGWDMALVMVGTLPFLAAVGGILAKMSTMFTTKNALMYEDAATTAQQSISQVRTVAAYCGEPVTCDRYESKLKLPLESSYTFGVITGVCTGSINAIMYFTYALAFIYGAWRVSTGDYTGRTLARTFGKGKAAGARLFKVMERTPSIDPDAKGMIPEGGCIGELEFKEVDFRYPARPDMQVFFSFSLTIPAGKTVALVGQSGSGKSTAAQLIERFYDPSAGCVLLDGINLRTLDMHWLRAQMGLVSQEPTLFATTIYENIAMGKPGATEDEIIEAAKSANAHNFITRLPLQYHTHVGERGLSLSGGQKQRVAIARAILKNPRVLLLDEATSALDTESERIVQAALDNLIVGRTTVVIAHRLSTINSADVIAVVCKGQVVEQGTHDELIVMDSMYASLVRLQMQEQQAKEETTEDAPVHDVDEVIITREVSDDSTADHSSMNLSPHAAPGGIKGRISHTFGRGSKELTRGSKEYGHAAQPGDLALKTLEGVGIAVAGAADDIRNDMRKGGPLPFTKPNGAMTIGAAYERGGLITNKTEDVEAEGGDVGKIEEAAQYDVPLSRLIALSKSEWHYAIMGSIAAAAVGAVQPAFALIISTMITTFYDTAPDEIMSKASFLSQMFFTIGIGMLIGSTVMFWCFGVIGGRIAYRIRDRMFRNIMYQEVGWFDLEENSSSILTTRLSTDAVHVRGAVADALALLMQNLFCLGFGFILAFVYNWRMALVVLAALPFMISGSIIHYRNMAGMETGTDKLYAPANQAVSDAFSSIRVVHAYGLRQQIVELYANKVVGTKKVIFRQSHLAGATSGYSEFCMFAIYGLIIWFGGVDVNAGRSTFNDMLVAFLAILLAAMGLAQSMVGFPDIGKAKSAVQHVFPLIDRQSRIDASKDEGQTMDASEFSGQIELRAVNFWYPARPSVQVFRDFSLTIPAGSTAALVGESGSGKSTVVGLIERFYDPQGGAVIIDGIDVRTLKLKWLRAQIGIVSQEPLLFSCSIIDNIRYGKPDATMEEVEAAAKAANAYDFISGLPDGFETKVGDRGMQLSGGQKQRVAIARAVIKQPKIMLLDEATSALDASAEHEVQMALDKIMVGRTSVIVAHRLSTVRNADMIALVYRGAILERGSHDELMAVADGGYAKLVRAQMRTATKGRAD
ncbi:hypothetical protein FOA52_000503 [Chlamydomonas sp. UWO 241]|nr:hypothetical protein FOA52_000503 [Chlamydomonas sp. UWO 241]